jgi:hypothetical protein
MTLPLAEAAVEDLRHAHRELLGVVDSLSASDWERFVPYGEWTVKDLVAHAIGDMSPSGPGLIHAGVLTPEFIADTSKVFDVRTRNASIVEERRRYTREDLRQLLFDAHDAMIDATLRLDESHLPVLAYSVPMGPEYEIKVEDWLWHGYHDRQHADDIRRAVEVDWQPERLTFLPEIDAKLGLVQRYREGLLRAIYSAADDAWEEPATVGGWTYKQDLAHIASNDLRPQTRLRAILGEAGDEEMVAIVRTDEWNQARVDERKGWSVRRLVDDLAANRHQTLKLLARLRPEHLSATISFASGDQVSLPDYVGHIGRHDAMHAGHLVPVSRARRFAMKSQ